MTAFRQFAACRGGCPVPPLYLRPHFTVAIPQPYCGRALGVPKPAVSTAIWVCSTVRRPGVTAHVFGRGKVFQTSYAGSIPVARSERCRRPGGPVFAMLEQAFDPVEQ